jgi:hypothetical protein
MEREEERMEIKNECMHERGERMKERTISREQSIFEKLIVTQLVKKEENTTERNKEKK